MGYLAISKSRTYLFHFPRKIQFVFALFGLFLVGNTVGSPNQVSKSKFDIYYQNFPIWPTQFLVFNVRKNSSTFQFCGYRWQKTFQKNVDPIFWVWLLLSRLVLRNNIEKNKLDFLIDNLCSFDWHQFLKSQNQKQKISYVCPSYIREYMAVLNLICQRRHQKRELYLTQERKMIMHDNFFCS